MMLFKDERIMWVAEEEQLISRLAKMGMKK